ncbi:MAG: ABC transporter permease [Bacillota bacterium]
MNPARKAVSLVRQDLVLLLRNALAWVVLGTLAVMVLVVVFAVPSEETAVTVYYCDATPGGLLRDVLLSQQVEESLIVSDREALREAVLSDPGSIGVSAEGAPGDLTFTVLHSGELGAEARNGLTAAFESLGVQMTGREDVPAYTLESLRPPVEPVPPNLNLVPILLAFEVLVLGFLVVAVMLFQEKAEGSIRAYRVSPGGTTAYLLSKVATFTLMGLLYGAPLVLLTVGRGPNYPLVLAATALGAALYTCLGLAVAVMFRGISDWFVAGVGLLVINMFPLVSYVYPPFSPALLSWIPSHPILFGFREILFPTGRPVSGLMWLLAGCTAVAFAIAHRLVEVKLMREGQ